MLFFFYTNDNGGLLILLSLLASPSTSITIVVTALAIALPCSLLCITCICPICSSLNIDRKRYVFYWGKEPPILFCGSSLTCKNQQHNEYFLLFQTPSD